jgi:branched-subunit amino acid transport protein
LTTEQTWELIGGCALVTVAIKATGPVALGHRRLPSWVTGVVRFMAPALLAALVCVSALAHGHHLGVASNTAGVGVGGLLLLRRASVIVAVLAAAAVTGGIRAL